MKYFLHDSNAFNDDKVTELYIKFGYEGLGLFYTMLEKFAAQEKPIKTLVLKKQLNVGKKLEKCWNFLEEIGLIQSTNGETFNERILNFAGTYKIKSEKNAERVSQWRENQAVAKNVTHYESVRNAPKVKESKVNRSKVKESKEIIKTEPLVFVSSDWELLWQGWADYKQTEHRDGYKSAKTEQVAINKLVEMSGGDLTKAQDIVKQSIANRWKGLFTIKQNTNVTTKSNFDVYQERREQLFKAADEYDRQRGFRPREI